MSWIALGACSGEERAPASRDQSILAAGSAPTAGAPAPADTSDGDAAFHNVSCDPAGAGVCQNSTDCPAVESGFAREVASNCGPACLGAVDEHACTEMCISEQTGLTPGCSSCYVEIVVCSRDLCLPPCLMDPESRACFDCQQQNGCRAAFDACSGLPPASRP